MTTLLLDGLLAAVKFLDRALTAVENVRHRPVSPAGGAQPAGADHQANGTGGHPIEATSELLESAANEILALGILAYAARQPWVEGFAAELRDRAAQFKVGGD